MFSSIIRPLEIKSWINTCLKNTEPFNNSTKSVLLMDNYGSHKDADILALVEKSNFEPVFIPPRITSYLQPLDVVIYSILRLKWKWKGKNGLWMGKKYILKMDIVKGLHGKRSSHFFLKVLWKFKTQMLWNLSDSGISQNGINMNEKFLNSKLKDILYSSNVEN